MRQALLAVIALLSIPGCKSRAPATSSAAAPDSPSAAAPNSPAAPAIPLPPTTQWDLDPENSSVEFTCKHVLSTVRGMFKKPSGTVTWDDATPAHSIVAATIDASSITTGVEERDQHLKSGDFFDVAKYPTITFASTSVTRSSATSYSVTGNLTMHGVTRPVTLAVTASPPFHHAGGVRRGIEATTTVNRKEFGLVWDYPGEGPGIVVGDNIKIAIDAELVLQGEAGKTP